MPHGRITLAAFAFAAMTGAAGAQGAERAVPPDTTPCPEPIVDIATCYIAKDETGAYITAALPKTWNGNLVVFAHGGPWLLPPTAIGSKVDLNKYSFAVRRGFAWVASSHRREGYGVAMAAADSDNARKFFIARIGKPQRTILHGASYGGLVGAKLVEAYAKAPNGSSNFDGAFLNSAAVMGRR
jgi:hypothetical protein